MKRFLRSSGRIFFYGVSIPLSGVAQVSLPIEIDFEVGEGYAVDDSPTPFVATGTASVTAFDSFSGDQSVLLSPGTTGPLLDLSISDGVPSSVRFVDFFLKPVLTPTESLPSSTAPGVVALSAVVGEASGSFGSVWAADGTGTGDAVWVDADWEVLATDGVANQWIRFTYRLDYGTGLWDLYLNNDLVLANLAFLDPSAVSLTSFQLRGDADKEVFFDYFYAGGINPLFEDVDQDGVDDAYETAEGMSTSLDDRDEDNDFDALSNLEEFLKGLLAGTADSDGDGIPDGLEIAEGTDPLVADRSGLAPIPFAENFESDAVGSPPSSSFSVASGGAVLSVIDEAGTPDGLQSLQVENTGEAGAVVQYFAGSGQSVVWLDFYGKLGWVADDEYPEIARGSAGVFFQREDGRFLAFDGEGDGGGVYRSVGSPGDWEAWRRVTLRLDYGSQTWSLWIDDIKIASDYGFAWNSPYFSRFKAGGDAGSRLDLDAVTVSTNEPLGLDDDGDGMDSIWERQFGLDPNDPSDVSSDSDSDFWTAEEEYRLGLEPNVADAGGLPFFDGFEAYPTGETLHGKNQWVLSLAESSATPDATESAEGAQSLLLTGSEEDPVAVERHFQAVGRDVVTLRLMLKPQGYENLEPEIAADSAAAFYFGADGLLRYFDGSTSTWMSASHTPVDPAQWQPVSLELDYVGGTYAVWLEETTLVANVTFASPQTQFRKFRITEQSDTPSRVDAVAIYPFADRDFDVFDDGYEQLIVDADPNDSLNSIEDVDATADPDGDGLDNSQEYAQGKLPFLADADVQYYVDQTTGDDSAYNGLSAIPGLPRTGDGPKQSLAGGLFVAAHGSRILIREGTYDESTLNSAEKDVILRPSGNVVLR
ncbi:thrombospondin type 3 repeat-containing protein [Puniceicoccus vermicola]|uniref:LamG domain-containing protein n=1 Tax=Puniceicoccus vermicola TaxID=388746 RepID=A0A7X1B3U6_9BACT|nr:thrombospondin type 3 repeat-containing protein [Puniceicoccus vermicola]MBC2603915.1 hypothetical protein [Puniceicoccus vermicola]